MALQYCAGFYQTSTWVSHGFTHVLPNINMNQSWVYPCPFPLDYPSYLSPHPSHLSPHPSPLGLVPSRASVLSSLSYTAKSHWLSILHMVMYVSCYSLHTSHPPLPPPSSCVHKSVLSVCASIAADEIQIFLSEFYLLPESEANFFFLFF